MLNALWLISDYEEYEAVGASCTPARRIYRVTFIQTSALRTTTKRATVTGHGSAEYTSPSY
jgi:hypothetical protein